ncbi:hypothetical protein SVIO_056300 [Streptomyces violaceusniger]|uniref:DUF2269 domain-containing protein n=2 Tax=Streptomyces TaxID=1883 RepID=A0A4D4L8P6_STRVO|nr:hypothetical protein SVIO_056300 [Streptomyces violaceusniger]
MHPPTPTAPARPRRREYARILPTSDAPGPPRRHGGGMRQLTRPVRRGLLVLHVVVSVGWLGLTLGVLALGITGAMAGSAEEAGAAYRSMNVLGDWLLIPISLLSLASGIVLSLGTPWGLARHRWVYVKFWLTLITTAATAFALRARIDAAMADVVAGRAVGATTDLILAPSVSLGVYTFLTAISVIKPWGLTARGRRLRATKHR